MFDFVQNPYKCKIRKKYRTFANKCNLFGPLSTGMFMFLIMKLQMRRFASVLLLLAAVVVSGAGYPEMSQDKAVSSGVLPDGLTYYIVSNTTEKLFVDIALVQKVGLRNELPSESGMAVNCARGWLDSLPMFSGRSPYSFLASSGVSFGKDGYVSVSDRSTVFRFSKVPVIGDQEIVDSTLLMVMDIARQGKVSENPFVRRNYTTANQAVVVSGDIDSAEILKKLKTLSLMVPHSDSLSQLADSSVTVPLHDTITITTGHNGLCSVVAHFSSERVPEQHIGTVLPFMSARLWNEASEILKYRISEELELSSIPVASVNFSYKGSGDHSGDEQYSMEILVRNSDSAYVSSVVKAVFADIAQNGIPAEEYAFARTKINRCLKLTGHFGGRGNSVYADRCISSFLYGLPIVSDKDYSEFFLTSAMSDDTGAKLLAEYIKGLSERVASGASADFLKAESYVISDRDTLSLPSPSLKVSVRRVRADKITGGASWLFQNGMTVIYKKMPTDGRIYYSYDLRGGYSTVSDLQKGEGAYFSDVLMTGKFCGIPGRTLQSLLMKNGVSLDAEVNMTDLRLSGVTTSDKFDLALKSLLAVSNGRTDDHRATEYKMECEKLRLRSLKGSYTERLAIIDSILCPGYAYSKEKCPDGIVPDIADHAAEFFEKQFSKANDGAIVIVGDIDETDLRKKLQNYIGGFRTRDYAPGRPAVLYQPIAGAATYTKDGDDMSLDVVMSSRIALTKKNYMAARIASMALEDALVQALSRSGMYVDVYDSFLSFPQERFNVAVAVAPANSDGLPASVSHLGFLPVLYAVRYAVSYFAENPMTPQRLSMYKSRLESGYDFLQNEPEYWSRLISERLSSGKVFNKDYKEYISSVTAEDVMGILRSLTEGGKVEYVVK